MPTCHALARVAPQVLLEAKSSGRCQQRQLGSALGFGILECRYWHVGAVNFDRSGPVELS